MSGINIATLERAFAANFAERDEVGAAVCIFEGDREVAHLTGGTTAKGGGPWTKDTIVPAWSCTKGPSALTLLLVLHEAGLRLDAALSGVWPELKAKVSFGELLSHQAGLASLSASVAMEPKEPVIAALEQQEPAWTPGTAHGYHPRTFGFLLDECVRRITGRSLGDEWRRRVATPLGIDFHIGVAEEHFARIATLYPGRVRASQPAHEAAFRAAISDSSSVTARAFTSPKGGSVSEMNRPASWKAGWPGHGGIGSAGALAKFYGILAAGGICQGDQVIPEVVMHQIRTPLAEGMDLVLKLPTRFSAGFMLDPLDPSGKKLRASFGPGIAAFGHPGAGGSVAFADPERRIGFAYVMNQMEIGVLPGEKALALMECLERANGAAE